MLIKLYGTILIMLQLFSPILACNYKLLDMEADRLNHHLQSNIPITENTIKESLIFLSSIDNVDKKYFSPGYISVIKMKYYLDCRDKNFIEFYQSCKKFYDENNEDLKKIGVLMLCDKTSEKYSKVLKLLEKKDEINSYHNKNATFADRYADNERSIQKMEDFHKAALSLGRG